MSDNDFKKGDQLAWNYGGGRPEGKVVEKETEGELAIESKRGNTIKKNADEENPAYHLETGKGKGDVVKRGSELEEV